MRRPFISVCLAGAIFYFASASTPQAAPAQGRFAGYSQLDGTPPGVTFPAIPLSTQRHPANVIPSYRLPPRLGLEDLHSGDLQSKTVALHRADTLAAQHLQQREIGWLKRPDGLAVPFNPEVVLVKFRDQPLACAIRVPAGRELEAARVLKARSDVEYSELDLFEDQAFVPDDPLLENQWHHKVVGSFQAWDVSGFGKYPVQIAIVDTPFQMDHPDLALNAAPGWDVDTEQPILTSPGIVHSTLAAGLAAAGINNQIGVAGVCDAGLLPVNINGSIDDMYKAIVWAAEHGVRVVNISWTGGDSDTLNTAGAYLKSKARGLLVMAGGNLGVTDYTTNQPDIWCISGTDAADNMQSLPGVQVDFAAPGWGIYSTTINCGYTSASGTSYSAPLASGIIAALFSLNPLLGPDEVIDILKRTAVDKGPSGWDQWYGWGRLDFAAAAREAQRLLPRIEPAGFDGNCPLFSTAYHAEFEYRLWRASAPAGEAWTFVQSPLVLTNGEILLLKDPQPAGKSNFYRLGVSVRLE